MRAPPAVAAIASHAASAGFDPKIILIAAVSRTPQDVKSGTGVMDVIERVLDRKRAPQPRLIKPVRTASAHRLARNQGVSRGARRQDPFHPVILVGGPDSGKSNYIFRIWLAISNNEGRMSPNGLPSNAWSISRPVAKAC